MKQLRFIVLLFALAFAFDASGADRITASVVITNAPTTNGMTFVITTGSASTRTWTNSVQVASTQVLTNETAAGSATNLALQLAATPPAGASALLTGASNITVYGATGVPLTISGVGSYFSVTYATNSITNAWTVRIPATVESPAQRTNVSSGVVAWIGRDENTNAIPQISKAAEQLVGLTNAQTITGDKVFTGSLTANSASSIKSTNLYSLDGSLYIQSGLGSGTTNTWRWRSYGTSMGLIWSQASGGISAYDFGPIFINDGSFLWSGTMSVTGAIVASSLILTNGNFIGDLGGATNLPADELVGAVPNVSLTNRTFESALFSGTNTFPTQSDIAFGRYALTSLANGNNAAVPVGTNVFVEVSGPSSTFTINGINAAGGAMRDGKLIVIVNQTGFDMTVAHQSGTDPAAANRIISMTGSDRTTTGNGSATLIYSGASSRWLLISFDP